MAQGGRKELAEVAPPAGADADLWTDAGFRDVYEVIGIVETHRDAMQCPLVTLTARQHADRTLTQVGIEVAVHGALPATLSNAVQTLTPNHAGRLAMLLAAAVLRAEEWTVAR